jgi:IS30 family transposase
MLTAFSSARDATTTQYKQPTYEQRCQIEVLEKSGLSQKAIGEMLGVHQTTISRELRRNIGQRGLLPPKQAQQRTSDRRQGARKAIKMTTELIAEIEKKLAEKWSPEQISGWLKTENGVAVSYERIYQHVWSDKLHGGNLHLHLRRHAKRYQNRSNGKTRRGPIKNRVSIDERPEVVDERATQFAVSARVNGKSAEEVTQATIQLLTPYSDAVHTITADNGKEFAYHEKITKALDAQVYFAHPYHSLERGLNDNTNGLLRQYWPKKTDLKAVNYEEVKRVINQLNDRPRKTLAFQTPAKLMHNNLAALVA